MEFVIQTNLENNKIPVWNLGRSIISCQPSLEVFESVWGTIKDTMKANFC